LIATYHNHTKWSDGTSGVGELCAHADSLGVDILGISDHLCIYPGGGTSKWSMDPSRTHDYLADVLSFRRKGGMEIRVGLEFDWFEGHRNAIAPIVESLPLDYRIASVHHVERQRVEASASFWSERSPEERDVLFAKYWGLVREMAESHLFDIAAHLDIAKKHGFYPASDLGGAVDAALDAIAAGRMVVELNTSGYAKACAEAYPSPEILRKCRQRGIPVTLSSDAHRPENLLYEFERGLAALKDAGFATVARFREREPWFEPLDEALKSARR
jgi:histidinol-phosphatase (PHP family)